MSECECVCELDVASPPPLHLLHILLYCSDNWQFHSATQTPSCATEAYPAPFYIQRWIFDYMLQPDSCPAFSKGPGLVGKQYRILDVGVGTGQRYGIIWAHAWVRLAG